MSLFFAVPLAVTGVRTTGPSRWRLARDRRRVTFCELWSPRNFVSFVNGRLETMVIVRVNSPAPCGTVSVRIDAPLIGVVLMRCGIGS